MTNLPAQATTTAPAMLDEEFGLSLMEGEEILMEGRPQVSPLQRYMMLTTAMVMLFTVFGLIGLPIAYLVIKAYVNKHRFWLTNSRVVVTTGIIGFRARSIPLERVSDVAISCDWLEKLLGMRTVVVRDMTGEAMSGANMRAFANPTELQQKILDQVHQVNRREGKEPDALDEPGRPYRQIEGGQSSEMLELLRRIEANTRA
ncbi:MAG: PH domain-containing protein [Nannocystaceae bacterium]|nr:PH domain-containing protein [bacterium]